ncbi:MAG: mechanosensitive ion channel family protein, partial [Candidatus Cloacimonadaceae bacterium]|nr:mechanosensitive ion channel family protein [Candidatus Cloacimonadaceae bacterium]
ITQFFTPDRISLVVRVVLILGIGFPLVRLIRKLAKKVLTDKLSAQSEQLIQRAVYYLGIMIILVSVLNEFGFKLSALLGAAGVFGIAIGFASQTSVSNIISGIFLISEKPFMIGDVVQVGATVGVIQTIDLLSIKLKTFDSRFVRIPNETMIKSEVINITKYPIRRVNINVSVAYKEDLRRVLQVLQEIAANEPMALKEPEPTIQVTDFADSGIAIMFGVWANTPEFVELKTALMIGIKERFDKERIEIPFPHVSIYAGSESEPIKIKTT